MHTFQESALSNEILKAIGEIGFETPTPIQAKTIPHILESDRDLVALAQTGTGKTAAFGLPIAAQTDCDSKEVQTIILCPTRELCMQIAKDLVNYTKYVKNLSIIPVFGGASIDTQIKALRKGGQIVVGTPGRVGDLIRRRKLNLTKIKYLVLDEADEMLNMGFKEELDGILEDTPDTKQTLLFSATMPREISRIANRYMSDPVEVSGGKHNVSAENVEHHYYMVQSSDRYEALKRIVDINTDIYGIIFCRTRRETKEVADKLMQDGYSADALHGDLSQAQRDHVMDRFRLRHLQILVATDVAARGLDVKALTHVLNFNLPDDPETYIHRSGRTGRAGNKGVSVAIIHSRETRKLQDVERKINKKFERKLVPQGDDVCEQQLFKLVDKIQETKVDEEQIEKYLPSVYEKLENLSREEIIQKFVSTEFTRFLSYYKNARDLNVKAGANNRKTRENFSRFHINIGAKHRINPSTLMGVINDNIKKKGFDFGKIEILKSFSFFEIESKMDADVISSLNGIEYKGETIVIEAAKSKGRPEGRDRRDRERKRHGGSRDGGSRDGGSRGGYGNRRSGNSDGGYGGGGDRRRAKKRY